MSRGSALATATGLLLGLALFALNGQSTYAPPQTAQGAVTLQNQTINDDVVIEKATSVTIYNVTITGTLTIRSSDNIDVQKLDVTKTFSLLDSEDASVQEVGVGASLLIERTKRFDVTKRQVTGNLTITSSEHGLLKDLSIGGVLGIDGTSCDIFLQNVTTSGPTTQGTPACPEETPTTSYPPSFSGTMTTYPPITPWPTTTRPADSRESKLLLEGETLYQDLYIWGASEVTIRDSTVVGNVWILDSGNVKIESSVVTENVGFQRVHDISITGMKVGTNLGFDDSVDGTLQDVHVAQILGFSRSDRFVLFDVQAMQIIVFDSKVQRLSVTENAPPPLIDITNIPLPSPGVKLNVSESGVSFEYEKTEDGSTEDLKVEVNAKKASASLRYAADQAKKSKAVKLDSHFDKFIEFEDRNGNGAYDANDRVLKEYLLEDLPVEVHQERLHEGDASAWRVTASYLLPEGGVLSLIFTASDKKTDQTKIDVDILGYTYHSSSSRVALQSRLVSAHKWDLKAGELEDQLLFHGQGHDGFFSWVRYADVDGRATKVVVRVLGTPNEEGEVVLLFSYERGYHIRHDPSLGVQAQSLLDDLTPGNLVVYGTTLLATFVAIYSMSATRRRHA